MEEICIGRGGMTAAEFDAATPQEAIWRVEGLARTEEAAWMRTAQLAAWVFGATGVKTTASKLLGR